MNSKVSQVKQLFFRCIILFFIINTGVFAQELQTIRTRMTAMSFDIPNEKRPVPKHSTNETKLLLSLDKFNKDGSYKTILPKISEAEKQNAKNKFTKHRDYLKDVKNIAVLYGYNNYYPGKISSSHHGKIKYKKIVYNTLKWYFANHKPPTSVYHQTFNYLPYNRTIVGLLEYTGMLLYEDFQEDSRIDLSINTLFRDIASYCHHIITDSPQTRGPNWSFRYGNCMRHILFTNDPNEMNTYMKINDASKNFDVWAVNGTDGIWPDGSLTHHGDEMYWGMYGTSSLANTLELAKIVKGTPWEYSPRSIQFIETSIIDGLQWILYKGNTEMTTAPKRLTYWLARTDVIASEVVKQLETLLNIHGDKLKNRAQIEYLSNNIDPSWKNSGSTYNEITGHKYFWNTEYQVHRRTNFSIAVRRTSQRVRGPEDSSNSDIKMHLHFGNGYTSILRTGDEYRLSRLGFDYQTLPGTTTELNGIVNSGKSASKKRGASLFSGGVQEDRYGAGAFEMKIGEYNTKTKVWDLINGAGALKGNFFFNTEMVNLGQDINRIKAGSNEIWTTINQLQRRSDIVYAIDEQNPITINLEQIVNDQLQINSSAWFWHDNVGYLITTEAAKNLKLIAERRTLNSILMEDKHYRNAISKEDQTLGTINMFQLAINHGINPKNETYTYKVIPDISLTDFKQYRNLNTSIVIKNSEKIQAVYNKVDGVVEAVFYEPGSFTFDNGKTVKVDKKSIILLRQSGDELFVSATNPAHRGLTPSFVESTSNTIGELNNTPIHITLSGFRIVDEVNNRYVVPIQLSTERGYEGKTETKKVSLRSNGGLDKATLPLLDEITIQGQKVAHFNPMTFSYTLNLNVKDKEALNVTAKALANYTITYLNTNTVQIKVNGQDQDTSTIYTIHINRKGKLLSKYTETFTNLMNTKGFITKQFVGDNNISWNLKSAKYDKTQKTGAGFYIRNGFVKSEKISTGISSFSVSLMNRFNDLEKIAKTKLFINNIEIATHSNSSTNKTYTFSVDNINIEGDFTIQLKNASDEMMTLVIDNISWTPYASEKL